MGHNPLMKCNSVANRNTAVRARIFGCWEELIVGVDARAIEQFKDGVRHRPNAKSRDTAQQRCHLQHAPATGLPQMAAGNLEISGLWCLPLKPG
jgi:hypothetical protein